MGGKSIVKVCYNEYKGYCVPRHDSSYFDDTDDNKKLITNGFDQLNWKFSTDGFDNDEDSYSIDEISVYVNNTNSIDTDITDESNDSDYKNSKKNKSKQKRKKKIKPNKRNKRKNHDLGDIDYKPSDPSKIKILNDLHSKILKKYQEIENKPINNMAKKPSLDERILHFGDISIYKQDLDNLTDDCWLNDNNISFVFEFLERILLKKYPQQVQNSILLLRPSMSFLLANFNEDVNLLKGVLPDFHKQKFIFLPINDNTDVDVAESGFHWSLVMLSLIDRQAFIFDTLGNTNEDEAKVLIEKVSLFLGDSNYFQVRIVGNTPTQVNYSDCGVMVCQIVSILLSRILDLENLKHSYLNLEFDNIKISAIDGRVFILATILNLLKQKLLQKSQE